jgi:carbonic anhydrase
MIFPILPAALASRDERGVVDLNAAVRENVRRVVHRLRNDTDPILLAPQRAGRLKVVGAYYDLEEGRVDFFDRPGRQEK